MSLSLLIGLGLALVASLALNASYVLQHRGLGGAPAVDARRPLRTLRGMLGSGWWLAGGALGLGGWVLHVVALTRAPLSLVQAFLAGGLVFAVPLAAWIARHPPRRREIVGVGVMACALAGLAVGSGASGAQHDFAPAALGAYAGGATLIAGAIAVLGRSRRPEALGLAGGILFGAGDAVVNALTGILVHGGLGDVLVSPWLLVAIAMNVGAFVAYQRGLQIATGRVVGVIALMTAASNVLAIAGGLAVFGDPLGTTTAFDALHVACFAAVVAAGWLLAGAQAALEQPVDEEPVLAPAPVTGTA